MAHHPVEISRFKAEPEASCEDCDRLPVGSTRERVRQHAKQTGHIARVIVRDITTYYGPKEGA